MNLQNIQHKIYELRGHRVMLDFDLAVLYEVQTKNLNLAVKRNKKRFPEDFMFQLTQEEWSGLRLQFATSNIRGGMRYLPHAFTEQGLAMLSGVLNSDKAIDVNIVIMRTFVFIRKQALTYQELEKRLQKLEGDCGRQFKDVYQALNYLLEKDTKEIAQKERKRIGF